MILLFFLFLFFPINPWKFYLYTKYNFTGYNWIRNEFSMLSNLFLNNQKIIFKIVDCSRKKNSCNTKGIIGIPTFLLTKYFHKKIPFYGPYDVESMIEFIENNTNITVSNNNFLHLDIFNKNNLQNYLDDDKCVVLSNIHQQYGNSYRKTAQLLKDDNDILLFSKSNDIILN